MSRIFRYFIPVFLSFSAYSQAEKKVLNAVAAGEGIFIDGKMKEDIWQTAPVADGFTMFQPDNGQPIPEDQRTEVRVLYDNDALYIFATLRDDPSKILKEITQRDVNGNDDMFGVFLNGFNDGQQDFQFFVSAAGVQYDRLAQEDGAVAPDAWSQDFSWDAIWASAVEITETGWNVELKIPYAAVRFPKTDKQTWGLNFYRGLRRSRYYYTWNPINSAISAVRTQNGLLTGIQNIKPPTRLFLIPYTSFYNENGSNGSSNKFKAGLDLKYGISESFTLDAILVPDFGQTRFDNLILNLSPYEQQFTENRPFFTEGTDLFSKGNLFYSRRIGGSPKFEPDYDYATETLHAPSTVNLLNAIKVSGRTKNGLGIGVLNAVTERTYGTITHDTSGEKRSVVVEPATNYNLLVLDQRFNQNSSVSLVNTNVMREGSYYDANVSGVLFDLNTRANSYKLSGDFKYSYVSLGDGYTGFKTAVNFEKTQGKHRYSVLGKYISADYDINDLGYTIQTDYHYVYADYSYRILNPTRVFNSFSFLVNSGLELQNTTGKAQDAYVAFSTSAYTKKNDYVQVYLQLNPIKTFTFYSYPNSSRWLYEVPENYTAKLNLSSNYNRAFAFDFVLPFKWFNAPGRRSYEYILSPRYRVNNRLSFVYSFDHVMQLRDRGYVFEDAQGVKIADRNVKTINTELTGKYALNPKMTLNLTARYYWSYSENLKFYQTAPYGDALPIAYLDGYNENFNIWNLDLSYSWWFAPGSQISVLYRNNASDIRSDIVRRLDRNLENLFDGNLNNIFSISLRYYIDYNSLR